MTSALTTTAPVGSPYLSPEELTNIKEVFQIFTYEGSEAMRKDDLRVALRVLGLEVSHQQYLGYCALFTTSAGRSVAVVAGGGGDGDNLGGEASMGSSRLLMRDSVVGGGPGASVMTGSISASSNAGTPTARSTVLKSSGGRAPGAPRGPIPNTFSLHDFIEICVDARDSRTEVVKAGMMEASTRLARGTSHSNFDYSLMKDPISSSSSAPTILTSRGKTIREAFSYCDESGEGSLTPKHLERMLQDLSRSVAICNTAFSAEALLGGSNSGQSGGGGGLSGIDVPSEEELTALLQDLGIDPKTGMTEEDLLKILSTSSSIL